MNLLLIPNLKAMGSAWASLSTQLFTALAQTVLAVVIMKLTINYRLLGKLALFVGFVLAVGIISREVANWYTGYFLMIGSSLLFAFTIRLINLKALTQIIRNEPE
jgi:hypothetical protein